MPDNGAGADYGLPAPNNSLGLSGFGVVTER
jgi:hypothetical protein